MDHRRSYCIRSARQCRGPVGYGRRQSSKRAGRHAGRYLADRNRGSHADSDSYAYPHADAHRDANPDPDRGAIRPTSRRSATAARSCTCPGARCTCQLLPPQQFGHLLQGRRILP